MKSVVEYDVYLYVLLVVSTYVIKSIFVFVRNMQESGYGRLTVRNHIDPQGIFTIDIITGPSRPPIPSPLTNTLPQYPNPQGNIPWG